MLSSLRFQSLHLITPTRTLESILLLHRPARLATPCGCSKHTTTYSQIRDLTRATQEPEGRPCCLHLRLRENMGFLFVAPDGYYQGTERGRGHRDWAKVVGSFVPFSTISMVLLEATCTVNPRRPSPRTNARDSTNLVFSTHANSDSSVGIVCRGGKQVLEKSDSLFKATEVVHEPSIVPFPSICCSHGDITLYEGPSGGYTWVKRATLQASLSPP